MYKWLMRKFCRHEPVFKKEEKIECGMGKILHYSCKRCGKHIMKFI